MSTIIMSACWPLQGMNASQKAVLISLADNANDDGVCWPSIKYIADRTCLSSRAVQGAIKWLADTGTLQADERQGRSTVYTVTPAAFAPPQEMRPANIVNTPANNVSTPADPAPTPANAAPITINNRNRTVKEPSIGASLPDWLPAEAWADWVAHRKAVKSVMTDKAAQLCIRKLEKLRSEGNDPVAVIEQSIMSGKWTDLYAVKGDRQQAPGRPATNADRNADWNARMSEVLSASTEPQRQPMKDMGTIDATV